MTLIFVIRATWLSNRQVKNDAVHIDWQSYSKSICGISCRSLSYFPFRVLFKPLLVWRMSISCDQLDTVRNRHIDHRHFLRVPKIWILSPFPSCNQEVREVLNWLYLSQGLLSDKSAYVNFFEMKQSAKRELVQKNRLARTRQFSDYFYEIAIIKIRRNLIVKPPSQGWSIRHSKQARDE